MAKTLLSISEKISIPWNRFTMRYHSRNICVSGFQQEVLNNNSHNNNRYYLSTVCSVLGTVLVLEVRVVG